MMQTLLLTVVVVTCADTGVLSNGMIWDFVVGVAVVAVP